MQHEGTFDHVVQLHARIGANALARPDCLFAQVMSTVLAAILQSVAPPYNASEAQLSEIVETLMTSVAAASLRCKLDKGFPAEIAGSAEQSISSAYL